MEDSIVSFEVAKLAKEKGFVADIFPHYTSEGKLDMREPTLFGARLGYEYVRETYAIAPTQSLLQKWLREVHQIHVNLSYDLHLYDIDIVNSNSGETIRMVSTLTDVTPYCFTKYEDALEVGLYVALELIK